MRKVLLKDIAVKAGVSIRTVLRVLNGEDHVKSITKLHVSAILSRYGYPIRQQTRRENLVIYGRKGNPLIEILLKGILPEEYEISILSLTDSPVILRHAFEKADIAILFSNPDESYMQKIREWNPDVFRIVCGYGYVHDAELLIIPNNQGIGQCAADYLCGKMNCRSVFAVLPDQGVDFAERIKAFIGQITIQYPEVNLNIFRITYGTGGADHFFESVAFRNSGIFLPGCALTREFVHSAATRGIRIPEDVRMISCDNPLHYMTEDSISGWKYPAFIEFHLKQAVEWVQYYLKYRPRTILTPAVTYLPFSLIENHFVIKKTKDTI